MATLGMDWDLPRFGGARRRCTPVSHTDSPWQQVAEDAVWHSNSFSEAPEPGVEELQRHAERMRNVSTFGQSGLQIGKSDALLRRIHDAAAVAMAHTGKPGVYMKNAWELSDAEKAQLRDELKGAISAGAGGPENPKDAIGRNKLPLHLWPTTATIYGAMGLMDGALKYGRTNWRVAGVKASIYYDAASRHLAKWFEGENLDSESGLPHLAHALASIAIIIDAKAAGKLEDDRQYPGGLEEVIKEMTEHVGRLRTKHADKTPKHWSIADADSA